MPYRRGPVVGRCAHCLRETMQACVLCAHPVCDACEERHDTEFEHKTYEG